jgi:hypothetical protein
MVQLPLKTVLDLHALFAYLGRTHLSIVYFLNTNRPKPVNNILIVFCLFVCFFMSQDERSVHAYWGKNGYQPIKVHDFIGFWACRKK